MFTYCDVAASVLFLSVISVLFWLFLVQMGWVCVGNYGSVINSEILSNPGTEVNLSLYFINSFWMWSLYLLSKHWMDLVMFEIIVLELELSPGKLGYFPPAELRTIYLDNN